MNKFYYFSKSKLQLVEIKNYKLKFVVLALTVFLSAAMLVYGGLNIYYSNLDSSVRGSEVFRENEFLREKLIESSELYGKLETGLDSLRKLNEELRVASNLPVIHESVMRLGTGGGSFNNKVDFLGTNENIDLEKALAFIDKVEREFEFQKEVYHEIKSALKNNEKLYRSIPAVKPCAGTFSIDGFGMRVHPILKIRRFHPAIDIITRRGTPVYAPGDGTVIFTGVRGGYGKTIEVNHGFGYRTLYAHLGKIEVSEGQKISRGDKIGEVGNTGLSTGPHLHYEVIHNGINRNPYEFMFDDLKIFNSSLISTNDS